MRSGCRKWILIGCLLAAAVILPACTSKQELPSYYEPAVKLVYANLALPELDLDERISMTAWTDEWQSHLQSQFGIEAEMAWEAEFSDYAAMLEQRMEADQLPDVFFASEQQFEQLIAQGKLEQLDALYNGYHATHLHNTVKNSDGAAWASAHRDGKLYGIPFFVNQREHAPVLWIREDLRQQLQLPEPRTVAQLLELIGAFTSPTMYGLGVDRDLAAIVPLLNALGAYKGIWTEQKGGKIAYSSLQGEMAVALETVQQLYRSGRIDPDFTSITPQRMQEQIERGEIGSFFGPSDALLYLDLDPNHQWVSYPVPAGGKKFQQQLDIGMMGGYWVAKKGYSHPELVLRLIEEWYEQVYNSDDSEQYEALARSERLAFTTTAPIKLYGESVDQAEAYAPWGNYRVNLLSRGMVEQQQQYPGQWEELVQMEAEWMRQAIRGADLGHFPAFAQLWQDSGGKAIAEGVQRQVKARE